MLFYVKSISNGITDTLLSLVSLEATEQRKQINLNMKKINIKMKFLWLILLHFFICTAVCYLFKFRKDCLLGDGTFCGDSVEREEIEFLTFLEYLNGIKIFFRRRLLQKASKLGEESVVCPFDLVFEVLPC